MEILAVNISKTRSQQIQLCFCGTKGAQAGIAYNLLTIDNMYLNGN